MPVLRARSVEVIQPVETTDQAFDIQFTNRRKRVAAYARVSTDNEEQLSSYEAQVRYYSAFIKENPIWDFVDVYADEGISATSTKNRSGFNRMIADAEAGKIDLILTKSISRFARNTVDTLVFVRRLRDKNVEVYFEKENIYTFDSKGEFMLTLLSSLAQEESRSVSQATSWGRRKAFAEGRFGLPYKQFIGYTKGPDNLPQVVEDEAKIVREIFRLFLDGHTVNGIARILMNRNIPSPGGKTQWRPATIRNILTNEKRSGNARLQKTFTSDFLTKKVKKNNGELPSYYVVNSHDPIVSPEVFDLVQQEILRRKKHGYTTRVSCFSSRIVCGDCGGFFGSKVWHSSDQYRRRIWQCNQKFKNDRRCRTPHLDDERLQAIFLGAFNQTIQNKKAILSSVHQNMERITDSQPLEAERDLVDEAMQDLEAKVKRLIDRQTSAMLSAEAFEKKHNAYLSEYKILKERKQALNIRIGERQLKRSEIKAYIKKLTAQNDLVTEFDESLYCATVETITINAFGSAVVRFKDGSEVEWTFREASKA